MTRASNKSRPLIDLVVIGTSWGGLRALRTVLAPLPADLNAPVAVVQHRAPDGNTSSMVELLQAATDLRVCELDDKDSLRPGTVHIAPADYHALVTGGSISLSTEERVRFSRPSIDVLFETAAEAWGTHLLAIVLTGANDDGANGVRAVRRYGGRTMAQSPDEAERPEMPVAAIQTGCVDEVAPLADIAHRIRQLCGVRSEPAADATEPVPPARSDATDGRSR